MDQPLSPSVWPTKVKHTSKSKTRLILPDFEANLKIGKGEQMERQLDERRISREKKKRESDVNEYVQHQPLHILPYVH